MFIYFLWPRVVFPLGEALVLLRNQNKALTFERAILVRSIVSRYFLNIMHHVVFKNFDSRPWQETLRSVSCQG